MYSYIQFYLADFYSECVPFFPNLLHNLESNVGIWHIILTKKVVCKSKQIFLFNIQYDHILSAQKLIAIAHNTIVAHLKFWCHCKALGWKFCFSKY